MHEWDFTLGHIQTKLDQENCLMMGDKSDDAALQAHDLKFEPWLSEAE